MHGHNKGGFAEVVVDLEGPFIDQCSAETERAGAISNRLVVDALTFEDEIELLMRLGGVIETERCQIDEPAVFRRKPVADGAHEATLTEPRTTRTDWFN